MRNTILNNVAVFGRNKVRKAAITAAALACMAAAPTVASAHDHRGHVDVVVPAPRVYVQPDTCEADRIWVPAEYRTVTDRVWIEPVTTLQVQRVDIPAQYGYRDVVYYDRYGYRHFDRQQVLISPAHCEERSVPVVVCPGHFEEQTHQVQVCEGHWETREIHTDHATAVIQVPHLRLQIPLPF